MKTISFSSLKPAAQTFLENLNAVAIATGKDSLPMPTYVGTDLDNMQLIGDFTLPQSANKAFEAGAATHNLWRGGVYPIITMVCKGVLMALSIYDDRHQWLKSLGCGIAQSGDAVADIERELGEEAFLCDRNQRLVSFGVSPDDIHLTNSLGNTATSIQFCGFVNVISTTLNPDNRGHETVAHWHVGEVSDTIIATYEEGGFLAHVPVVAIDVLTGQVRGFFSAGQGLVLFDGEGANKTLHSTLKQYLPLLSLK